MINPNDVSGAINTHTEDIQKNTTLSGEALAEQKKEPSPSAVNAIKEQPLKEDLKNTCEKSLIYGNLSDLVIEQTEKMKSEIMAARRFSESLDPKTLFEIAEKLIAFRGWLVNYLMLAESKYREKVAELKREGNSAAGSELEAKTSDEYRAYKYLNFIDDIADEQIKLTKRFSDKLENEFRNL